MLHGLQMAFDHLVVRDRVPNLEPTVFKIL